MFVLAGVRVNAKVPDVAIVTSSHILLFSLLPHKFKPSTSWTPIP